MMANSYTCTDDQNTNFMDFQENNPSYESTDEIVKESFENQEEIFTKQQIESNQNTILQITNGSSRSTQYSANHSSNNSNTSPLIDNLNTSDIVSCEEISSDQTQYSEHQKYLESTKERLNKLKKYEIYKYQNVQGLVEEIQKDMGNNTIDTNIFNEKLAQYKRDIKEIIKQIDSLSKKIESEEFYKQTIMPLVLSHIDFFFNYTIFFVKKGQKSEKILTSTKRKEYKICLCGQISIGVGSFNTHIKKCFSLTGLSPYFKLYQCFKTGSGKQREFENFSKSIEDYINGLDETQFSRNYQQFKNDYHLCNLRNSLKQNKNAQEEPINYSEGLQNKFTEEEPINSSQGLLQEDYHQCNVINSLKQQELAEEEPINKGEGLLQEDQTQIQCDFFFVTQNERYLDSHFNQTLNLLNSTNYY
ncbi:hypothetical protein ABPG74_009305 [Tetrahymena malaccensis]